MDKEEAALFILDLAEKLAYEHDYNERRDGHVPAWCSTCQQLYQAFKHANSCQVHVEEYHLAPLKG